MKKRGLIALVVLVVIVIAAGGVFAWRGEGLMGRISQNLKLTSATKGNWQWWCVNDEAAVDSSVSGGGSSGDASSDSGSKFSIDPEIFTKIQSAYQYNRSEKLSKYIKSGTGADNGDEITPKGPESENWRTVTCSCPVNDPPVTTYYVSTEEFVSKYNSSEEAYCAEMEATDEYCKNPITITCACEGTGEQKTQTMSEKQFEETYDGDEKKACASISPGYLCNAYYVCPDGKHQDNMKIYDKCFEASVKAKSNQCTGTSYKEDVSLKKVCEAFNYSFDYLEDASCASKAQCENYKEIYESQGLDGLKAALDADGVNYETGETCYALYGIVVPVDGSKGWQ